MNSADRASDMTTSQLGELALRCRRHIVKMIHSCWCWSSRRIIVRDRYHRRPLWQSTKVRCQQPRLGDRDRFIMSKGHASPAVYSILFEMGFITEDDMMSFRKLGSVCQGHVDMKWTNGVDFSAGSLGMGLSFGLGCALAARMDSSNRDVWVMVGDGEIQEGQFWEAAMAADFHSVGRLNLIVDRNRIQNDDFVEVQMEVGDVGAKLASFGWDVMEIDGHDMEQISRAIEWSSSMTASPTAIVAHTIKGKGVSFMEDNPSFHGKAPNDNELVIALEELS